MCGVHGSDGSPIGHDHDSPSGRPIFRPRPVGPRGRSRRAFLGEVTKGTMALAIVTPLIAACGDDSASDGAAGDENTGDQGADDQTSQDSSTDSTAAADGAGADTALRWGRANLGFVSAFVLARGTEAAIVDTGVEGSAPAIGETLNDLGLDYSNVRHLILTHKHGDHAGSLAAIAAEATAATVYAGEADLGGIDGSTLDEDIVGLVGGEDVFGLEMLATPGHTAGHMAVIDHDTGLLVAGDAIFTEDGGVIEGPERFFEDIPQSHETIRQLAALSYNTLLVGHGEPIEANANTAVAALADSLG